MLEHFTEEIIRLSDNSAGTVLNTDAINHVVNALIESMRLDKDFVDDLIMNNETDSGYMVKASDFIHVLYPYIVGDLQEDELPARPEIDYEFIELLYGDYHAECGDR